MKTLSKTIYSASARKWKMKWKGRRGIKQSGKEKQKGNQGTWDPKELPGVVRGTRKDTKKQNMISLFSVFSFQFSVPVKIILWLHTLFFLQLPVFSFQFQPKWTFCVQLSVSSFGFVICYLLLIVEQITNNKCARHAGRQAGVEQIIFWVIYPSTKCGGNVPYFPMKIPL